MVFFRKRMLFYHSAGHCLQFLKYTLIAQDILCKVFKHFQDVSVHCNYEPIVLFIVPPPKFFFFWGGGGFLFLKFGQRGGS